MLEVSLTPLQQQSSSFKVRIKPFPIHRNLGSCRVYWISSTIIVECLRHNIIPVKNLPFICNLWPHNSHNKAVAVLEQAAAR